MGFQRLVGPRNVSVDLKYDGCSVLVSVCVRYICLGREK